MENKYVYRCPDSIEGIFTAIYQAWASVHKHEENRIEVECEENASLLLFAEYTDVAPNMEISEKVIRSVRNRISEEACDMILKGALSEDKEKGEIIYRFLIYAFREGPRACRSYGNPWAMKLFELVRNFNGESHLLKGFLRFDEYENGLFLARYAPKNDLTADLMEHFSDRLNTENFVIFDEKRRVTGVHPKGGQWFLYRLSDEEYQNMMDKTKESDEFAGLWRVFFKKIAIAERENRHLQNNNLPLHFRSYMTEFL